MGVLELVDPAWWTVDRGGLAVGSFTAAVALFTMHLNRVSLRETHRPMMLARLEYGGESRSPLDLIVTNLGRSLAHEVTVTFNPPLPDHQTSAEGQRSVIPLIRKRYGQTFPVWPPGLERRNVYWIIDGQPNDQGEVESLDGLAREVVATIRYKRCPGPWARTIAERFPLRISEFENQTFTSTKNHNSTRRLV